LAGCLGEERAQGAEECLRFSTGMANIGTAALHLSAGTRSRVDASVSLQQILPGEDAPAGTAAFHASHGHFHYAGFMTFALHEFDAETGLRGGEVLAKGKTGFCMVDWGLQADHPPTTPPKEFWRAECEPHSALLRMGISPGWYDLYSASLVEQFLESSTLADGTYELVTEVDPSGSLLETTRLDNRASLRFEHSDGRAVPIDGRGLLHL
jgi:hypothetical protein